MVSTAPIGLPPRRPPPQCQHHRCSEPSRGVQSDQRAAVPLPTASSASSASSGSRLRARLLLQLGAAEGQQQQLQLQQQPAATTTLPAFHQSQAPKLRAATNCHEPAAAAVPAPAVVAGRISCEPVGSSEREVELLQLQQRHHQQLPATSSASTCYSSSRRQSQTTNSRQPASSTWSGHRPSSSSSTEAPGE